MSWPPWETLDEKGLARYVIPELANRLRLGLNRDDAFAQPNGRTVVSEAIYHALMGCKICYSAPPYNPDLALQEIRDPDTLLDGSGNGTCLDLALLFAGAALGNELLPLLVLLKGHALVAVSTVRGRRQSKDFKRKDQEGPWVTEGVLTDAATLKGLVDRGDYLLIECTGFSSSAILPATKPEGEGRVDGVLSFDRAKAAGRAQLDRNDRPFLIAVDVGFLQDVGGFTPHEPLGRSLDTVPDLRRRLSGVLESHRVFGGRQNELDQIDNFFATTQSGYVLVTGPSGCGKSAVLANCVQRLTRRGQAVAYHFINRYHQLAGHEDTLQTLVQQLRHWRGRPGPVGGNAAQLEAAYLDLLKDPAPKEPIPKPVVVIVDGLDEADGWTVGPQLFPRPLPPGIYVVLSARELADRDWAKELDLCASQVIKLSPLEEPGIVEALQSANAPDWVTTPAAVALLKERSGGDPFYLRLLIADLSSDATGKPSRIRTLADLSEQPSGLDNYLNRWWTEIQAAVRGDSSVKRMLGYLLVARGPLTRDELIGLGPSEVLDWSTVDSAVGLVQRFVMGNADCGYVLCHWRFQDYLDRKKIPKASQRQYRQRLTEMCANWLENRSVYALRYGLEQLLDDGPEGQGRGAGPAVELCLCGGGKYLSESIRVAGLGQLEVHIARVFAAAFGRREWDNAGAALLALRCLHRLGRPLGRAVALLFGSDSEAIPERVGELEHVANHSTRLALSVLGAARWHDAGQSLAVDALLSWIGQQPGVAQAVIDNPASEALNAVFAVAPTSLVERLLGLPFFAEERPRWMALISLWARSRKEHHRSAVLMLLKGDPESASLGTSSAVECAVNAAADARDSEMLAAACRWLGRCPEPVQVEHLALDAIGEHLPADAPRVIELIRPNRRMENYVSVRRGVCALTLDGSQSAEAEFGLLAAKLADAAGVTLNDVRRSLAEYTGLVGNVWGISLALFQRWLAVRLAFMLPAFAEPDDAWQALLRRLTVNLCTILRWVATQEPHESSNHAVVSECMGRISMLAWRRPVLGSSQFVRDGGHATPPPGESDPLRAATCFRTTNWLATLGYLSRVQTEPTDDMGSAANREVLRLVFAPADKNELDRLDSAFAGAWDLPAPDRDGDVSRSPWLPAYHAIAGLAGVSWSPSWEADLGRDYHPLPERLTSYLGKIGKRVVNVVAKHGWHPALLDLCLNVRRMLGERELSKDASQLVIHALAEMDPKVLARCPNDAVSPPSLLPLRFARRVPEPLAAAVSTLELSKHGILRQLAEDLCRRDASAEWLQSVRQFREEVRRLIRATPPRVIWYERTDSPVQLLEGNLSLLSLLLDDPPQRDILDATDLHRRPLKELLEANPRPEILAWAVEKFRGYRDGYRLWLLGPLLRNRCWDLLARFLGEPDNNRAGQVNMLDGFCFKDTAIPQEAQKKWLEAG